MPGSAIVKELERLTEQKFHKGTIYPLFYEMEKKGFLKSSTTCEGRSHTQSYEITESGQKLAESSAWRIEDARKRSHGRSHQRKNLRNTFDDARFKAAAFNFLGMRNRNLSLQRIRSPIETSKRIGPLSSRMLGDSLYV